MSAFMVSYWFYCKFWFTIVSSWPTTTITFKLVILQSKHSKKVEKKQGSEGIAKIYALETQNLINYVSE